MPGVPTRRWSPPPCRAPLALCCALLALSAVGAHAQAAQGVPGASPAGLPTAEQVLADYHRAAGGRERMAAIRDVTVHWHVEIAGQPRRAAVSMRMAPGSLREEMWSGAANTFTPGTAWRRRRDGTVAEDTSAGVAASRLQASLEASHLVGLAEQGITAGVVGADSVDGERAYRVEFARDGATRVWLFGARSHLPLRVALPGPVFIRYSDYRPVDGVLEAHRVEITNGEPGNGLVFVLDRIRKNTGLTDADFQSSAPPVSFNPAQ